MANNPWLLVDSPARAGEAERDIARSALIGMDTEYDSLRYFHEKLCLLQIKAEEGTYIFDPLGDVDLSFLGGYLSSPSVCKIMHAGDNDIRLLKRDYGFTFSNIFDTHRAAMLLGSSRLSLSSIVGEYLGVELEKKKALQRSKWDRRPLTEEQLRYAASDTAYLVDLYHRLDDDLKKKGLQGQASALFSRMTMTEWRKKDLDQEGHTKIDCYTSLTERQKERVKRLFRWRYGKAKEINRALFMILSDQDMVDLSGLEIWSLHDLMASGILPPEKVLLFGEDLVELLKIYEGSGGFW